MITIEKFLQKNLWTESYRHIVHEYQHGKPNIIDMALQPERVINDAKKDLEIIAERVNNRKKLKGIQVGDFIHLPDGQKVIVSHVWDDKVQTSAGGSMHLYSSGGLSFSGGLDSGLKISDLVLTDKTDVNDIWIFHHGHSGGGRGVNCPIEFKVYEPIKGADLSGIPQVEQLRKQKKIEQSETIEYINGNGQPYTMHLPEVIMPKDKSLGIGKTVSIEGIEFKNDHRGLVGQPMKLKQIQNLLKNKMFSYEFCNNTSNKNKLYLTPVKYERERQTEFPKVSPFYQPKKKTRHHVRIKTGRNFKIYRD